MMGGTCQRVGPWLSCSAKTASAGYTCLLTKSVTCSMYIFVFFEYSNSIGALPGVVSVWA